MDAFCWTLDVPKGELRKLAAEGKTNIRNTNTSVKEQSQAVDELFGKTEQRWHKVFNR